jgi:hypothetical protein
MHVCLAQKTNANSLFNQAATTHRPHLGRTARLVKTQIKPNRTTTPVRGKAQPGREVHAASLINIANIDIVQDSETE